MSAPTFEQNPEPVKCNVRTSEVDPDHERPLSAILDVKDEILDKVLKLFRKKPIWSKKDLFNSPPLKQYSDKVLSYILQSAIDSGFQLKNANNQVGHLQARKNLYSFAITDNDTMVDRIVKEQPTQEVQLPVYEKVEEVVEVRPVSSVDLSAKREVLAPIIRGRFSEDVLDWYIVDSVLSEEDRTHVLLNVDISNPPIYAKPLIIQKGDIVLYVLGSKKIYNKAKELITPIGAEADAYKEWITSAKQNFVDKKNELFASLKDKALIFNIDEKSVSEITRALRNKVIGGRACTSYKEVVLNMFSEWLVGKPFPENVKTKADRCLYLDLLVREAVVSEKEGLFWVTPEEFQIFSEDEHRGELLKRLKD